MAHLRKIYCVDIGNTRTHCALVAFDGSKYSALESSDFPSAGFAEVFASRRLFESSGAEALSWCSVVPARSAEFAGAARAVGCRAMRLTHENSPIEIDMKNPAQLGHDRIAGAVGAAIFFEPPYISVDMGTAVTVDLVDSCGRYAGGAIAPGMHAFASYLAERAAQLPNINPAEADFDLVIGRDTVEAMYVGCAKGFCKLADGIISDIEREYFPDGGIASKTVFTGGSVNLLPKKWLAGRKIESNLSALGLARSYILNEEKQ